MKSLRGKLWLVALILLALVLLIMTRSHSPFVARVRIALTGAVAPVMELVNAPVRGLDHVIEDKHALLSAYEQNKELREENDALRHWQAVAQALKSENESLRALAGYKPVEQARYITAQVIAQSPDAYAGSLLIDAGSEDGLTELAPVIDAYGLVGRVVEMGAHTSRVLLLSDSSSRVPVISANSRQHAILAGTGESLMRMTFVGGDAAHIQLGEPIMTTSEGGLIPESVMVGSVFRRDAQGLLVKPVRPLARAEYVRVMVAK